MPPLAPVTMATLPCRFMRDSSKHWPTIGGAAVDGDDRSAGIGRLVRREEGYHPADLFRGAGAAEGQRLHQLLPPVRVAQPILCALLHDGDQPVGGNGAGI